MKSRLIADLAIIMMLVAASPVALAEKQPWACQYTAEAGLRWENGQWKTTTFIKGQPFVLVEEGDVLTSRSVGRVMGRASNISCVRQEGIFGQEIYCRNLIGHSLVFSPSTGQGGASTVFGALDNDPKNRDTLSVSHFTCQKY